MTSALEELRSRTEDKVELLEEILHSINEIIGIYEEVLNKEELYAALKKIEVLAQWKVQLQSYQRFQVEKRNELAISYQTLLWLDQLIEDASSG